MPRRPPPRQTPRPSPLAQVQHTRPLSTIPDVSSRAPSATIDTEQGDMGLVRDPYFWKRFSVAVHQNEGGDAEPSSATSSKGSTRSWDREKERDDWLYRQRKEQKRCQCMCVLITIAVLLVAAGVGVALWYVFRVRRVAIHINA